MIGHDNQLFEAFDTVAVGVDGGSGRLDRGVIDDAGKP